MLGPDILQRVWTMRRMYAQMTAPPPQGAGMDQTVATEAIINRMAKTRSNQEFLETLHEIYDNDSTVKGFQHEGHQVRRLTKKSISFEFL